MLATISETGHTFGACYGGRGTEYARYEARDCTTGRALNLTAVYETDGPTACHRIARRWGLRAGFIAYWRKARQRKTRRAINERIRAEG